MMLALRHVGDSRINCRVIHERSASRRADPCNALAYEMISGSESKNFCPAEKAMSAVLQRTTACSLTRFFIDTERAFPGVICRRVSAIGRLYTSASTDGQRAA